MKFGERKPASVRKTETLTVRLTLAESAELRRLVQLREMTITEWVRAAILSGRQAAERKAGARERAARRTGLLAERGTAGEGES